MLLSLANPMHLLMADLGGRSILEYALLCGLAVFMLAATILMWTRWGHVKPLWKCVALSVFAHILLGGYAYGTRLFFSYSHPGEEQPISFSISQDEEETSPQDELDNPDSSQPWNQFLTENEAGPPPVTQEKLNSHEVAVPKRDTDPLNGAAEIPFQKQKLSDWKPAKIASQESPKNAIEQSFEIDKSQVRNVDPRGITPPAPSVRRDTQFPAPNSVEKLAEKIESSQTPHQNSIEKPKASTNIATENVVEKLAENIKGQPAAFADSSPAPQDANSIPESADSNQPWRSVSWPNQSNEQIKNPNVVTQPRRLGDGLPIPKVYQNRFSPNRAQLVEKQGGSKDTEKAVEEALRWLSLEQEDDGSWNPRRYNAGEETNVYGHNRSGAGYYADSGITGLVILSFLGAGHTHLEGKHQKTVQKGLEYLIRTQHQDGSLYGNAGLFARTYCHAMAMLAITEAYSITGDHRIKPFIEKAHRFTVTTQNQNTGGWRYRPGDDGDMSQFGWQVLALKSAEQAGLAIPEKTQNLMKRFLGNYSKGKHGGLAAYRPAEKPSRTMTAESILCKRLLNLDVSPQASREAVEFVLEELPSESKIENLYYWYYATLALHQEKNAFKSQLPNWNRWNHSLTQKLLNSQERNGSTRGSFPNTSLWSSYGGRFYSTAMSTLSLEIYYRYQPSKPDSNSTASNNRFHR